MKNLIIDDDGDLQLVRHNAIYSNPIEKRCDVKNQVYFDWLNANGLSAYVADKVADIMGRNNKNNRKLNYAGV
jgi:hypothetical protein